MWFRLLPMLTLGCSAGLSNYTIDPVPDLDSDADVDTDTDDLIDTDADSTNSAPEANAGPDSSLSAGQLGELDARASTDPDNDELSYTWVMVESPPSWSGEIFNHTREQASFYADAPGLYVVELEVDDGQSSAFDEVTFLATEPNNVPVANAGPDVYGVVGQQIYLDGTNSADPEADAIDFEWMLVDGPVSSSAQLVNPTVVHPSFTPDEAGVYVIELIVEDTSGNVSSPDSVRVIAEAIGETSGGGLWGCLSCSAANNRMTAGDAAAVPFLFMLPLLFVIVRRRED